MMVLEVLPLGGERELSQALEMLLAPQPSFLGEGSIKLRNPHPTEETLLSGNSDNSMT